MGHSDFSKLVEPDRVRKEVYTDAEIFEREMERIHETVWIYCGHESRVPKAATTARADRPPADDHGARLRTAR
jgi:hypothetical protein